MKYLRMIWIVCLLFILLISCQKSPQSGILLNEGGDSFASANADSLRRKDPWIKYSYTERQGKRLFEQYCIICHGQNGEGDGFNAYSLNPKPRNLTDSTYMKALSQETQTEIISYGGLGVNKSVLMPAFQNTITQTQISNVVAYIETFTQNRLPVIFR